MDEKQKSLENWRKIAKWLQEEQKKQGLPVTPDEEVEKTVQEIVRNKYGTET